MTEKLVWDIIGSPLAISMLKLTAKGPISFIKKQKIKSIKKKFVSKIDKSILDKYGDKEFYSKLARCLFIDENINLIYERCYQRKLDDTLSDNDFIYNVLSSENWEKYEFSQVFQITKHILDSLFLILNVPNTDQERKITNIVLKGFSELRQVFGTSNKKILDELTAINSKIGFNDTINLLPSPVMNLLKSNKYNMVLHAKQPGDFFRFDIWIDYTSEIMRFQNVSAYVSYINFCGEEKDLAVSKIDIYDSNSELVKSISRRKVDNPMVLLNSFYIDSLKVSLLSMDEDIEQLVVRITPPKMSLVVDFENATGDKILTNVQFNITRRPQGENNVEVFLKDEKTNPYLQISFYMNIYQSNVIESSFSIGMKNFANAHSRYAFYNIINSMKVSSSIKLRDIRDNNILCIAQGIKLVEDIPEIDDLVGFYRKLIFIQDELKLNFILPGTIYEEDLRKVELVFELMTNGYMIDEKNGFHFGTVNTELSNHVEIGELNALINVHIKLEKIPLLGSEIILNNDLYCIVPKSLIIKNPESGFDLIPQSKIIWVFRPVYGDFEDTYIVHKHEDQLY